MALSKEDRPWTNQKSKFNPEEDVVNNSKAVVYIWMILLNLRKY